MHPGLGSALPGGLSRRQIGNGVPGGMSSVIAAYSSTREINLQNYCRRGLARGIRLTSHSCWNGEWQYRRRLHAAASCLRGAPNLHGISPSRRFQGMHRIRGHPGSASKHFGTVWMSQRIFRVPGRSICSESAGCSVSTESMSRTIRTGLHAPVPAPICNIRIANNSAGIRHESIPDHLARVHGLLLKNRRKKSSSVLVFLTSSQTSTGGR